MATKVTNLATGLYLKAPHGILVSTGKKHSIASAKLDKGIIGEHVIISKQEGVGLAFGLATIGEPHTILRDDFNQHFDSHRVTTSESARWWPDNKELYIYPITDFTPFSSPRPVEVLAGTQMLMGEVKYLDEILPEVLTDERAVAQEEIAMPWKPSDAQGHTKLADTPKKQRQWAEIANSALASCMEGKEGDEARKKCEGSAIAQANSVVGKSKEMDERLTAVQQLCDQLGVKVTIPSVPPESGDQSDTSLASQGIRSCHCDTNSSRKELEAVQALITEALKATEPDQSTCTCPNCKAEVDHEEGTPCREIKCPDCGSMCRGGGGDAEDAGDKANSAVETLANIVANRASISVPEVIAAPVVSGVTPVPTVVEPVAIVATPALPEAKEEVAPITPIAPIETVTAAPVLPAMETPTVPIEPTHTSAFDLISLLTRAKSAIASFLGLDKPDTLPAFKVFTTKSGKTRIVLWTTNSYRDREGEIFSIQSIKDYVARKSTEPTKGEFWYGHIPGTKFGTVDWQDVVADRFLVQVGSFDNTPVGDTFKSFFTKHPTAHKLIAPNGWGASHGYNYIQADRKDGVYNWFNTVESSVLPMHRAANIHNPSPFILGGKQMDEKSTLELRTISEEVGVDLLTLITRTAEQRKSELDATVDHKSTEPVQPDAQAAPVESAPTPVVSGTAPVPEHKSEQATGITEAQLTVLIPQIAKAFGMDSLSQEIARLRDTLEKQQGEVASARTELAELKQADEKKLEERAQSLPNFESFSWLRPSQSPTTVLTSADGKLKAAGPRVPAAIARLSEEI